MVRRPDLPVSSGSRHLAATAIVRLLAATAGWDSTATADCRRAATACSNCQRCQLKHPAPTAAVREAAIRDTMTAASIRSEGRRSSFRPETAAPGGAAGSAGWTCHDDHVVPLPGRLRRCPQPREPGHSPREPVRLVLDDDGHQGQGGRVLPVVMRAEQQVMAAAEQDTNPGPSTAAVAAVHGIHRPGRRRCFAGRCFLGRLALGPALGP